MQEKKKRKFDCTKKKLYNLLTISNFEFESYGEKINNKKKTHFYGFFLTCITNRCIVLISKIKHGV